MPVTSGLIGRALSTHVGGWGLIPSPRLQPMAVKVISLHWVTPAALLSSQLTQVVVRGGTDDRC